MIYKVQNLKYSYDKEKIVLNGINLEINEGEVLSILGRNGAGKTTFFKCLLGIENDIEGDVLLEGKDIRSLKEKDIASVVSFVPQAHSLSFGFTVFEYVLMGCAPKLGLFSRPGKEEKDAAFNALNVMGVTDFAHRQFEELSGGEKQVVAIARAIVSNPKLIFFDEPTAHLDFANQIKTLRLIMSLKERGFGVVVTSHDPNQALLLGGKTALLSSEGTLVFGNTKEIVTEENLRAIYGVDINIRHLDDGRDICIIPSI